MKIVSILRNIYKHPLNRQARLSALLRFFKWQLFSSLIKSPVVFPFVGKSVLVVEKGMAGATGNVYNGLHEYQDMLFTLHFLRGNDLFVDVGANVGSYTILASVNAGARVVSFEPIASTFQHLERNVWINNVRDRVKLLNKAAAAETKEVYFTTGLDAANHALSEDEQTNGKRMIIHCTTLDKALTEAPQLIKIDVEGFETEVIQGGKQTFANPALKAIIIELNGSGTRYGFNEEDIHNTLNSYGFTPYAYDPFNRGLKEISHWGTHNSIYIRDFNFVSERILTAEAININNLTI